MMSCSSGVSPKRIYRLLSYTLFGVTEMWVFSMAKLYRGTRLEWARSNASAETILHWNANNSLSLCLTFNPAAVTCRKLFCEKLKKQPVECCWWKVVHTRPPGTLPSQSLLSCACRRTCSWATAEGLKNVMWEKYDITFRFHPTKVKYVMR